MSLDAPSPFSIDGSAFRVGVVAARFNGQLVDALLAQVQAALIRAHVPVEQTTLLRVPGSGELPFAVQRLCESTELDVCVALGVIIKGDTIHYQLVAEAAQHGLCRVSLDARTPVIAGIVVADTQAQAELRCLGPIDRGAEFAATALEMAALNRKINR